MKISVVVPVYNARKYLRKCIDSVLSQSYHNFEVILVDDKSTDGSLEICKQYAQKYPNRVILVPKDKNEGVDKARFSGIEIAVARNVCGGG